MAYLIGIVLFALAIFVSISLHEAGHMIAAKKFGMKVTRYFAGFGPTLWSFRRGETEYGLKAIPLGGFVKIVGMTPQDDDVAPEDEPRAMWRFPVWQRTTVMFAGVFTNFLLGFVLLWATFAFVGVANPTPPPSVITVEQCVIPVNVNRTCQPGDPTSPAAKAGLKTGDRITALNGTAVSTYDDLYRVIRRTHPGPAEVTYVRDGKTTTAKVDLAAVQRAPVDQPTSTKTVTTAALGVGPVPLPPVTYNPLVSVGKAATATGTAVGMIFSSLKLLPAGVASLWHALQGGQRSQDSPVSVIGLAEVGGQTVAQGAWSNFFSLLVILNFFLAIFNLFPLLPLDGGHIAVAWFEKVRSWVYAALRRPDPGRVDYAKLAPLTFAVVALLGGLFLLTAAADIVNPVHLP